MTYSGSTSQTIFDTAVADGMPQALAALIVAQSKHETGNYTSKFFKLYHNCFGYSASGSRWQLHDATPNADNKQPIAAYASIQNSVHELTAWIKRRQKEGRFPADLSIIVEPTQYVSLLKHCGYFGDTVQNYLAGVTRFSKDLV